MTIRFNQQSKSQNFSHEIRSMIGTSAPDLMALPLSELEQGLANKSIDIGMCGLVISQHRLSRFDFTNPFYFSTGLLGVIKLRAHEPTAEFIALKLVNCIDQQLLLVLIFLLISVMVFGHLMSISDCVLHANPIFRKSYFEAVQDGIWMAFIMQSSIGFGDIVPKSLCSRVLAVVWMFLSISLMTIIYGIMSNNFGVMDLKMSGELEGIQGPEDMARFSVGSTLNRSDEMFRNRFVSDNFRVFDSQSETFKALINGDIQVAIERPELVTYYDTSAEFRNQFRVVGSVFDSEGVGFAVSRAGEATPHPLLNLLSLAVADATRTNWQNEQVVRNKWFHLDTPRSTSPQEDLSIAGYTNLMSYLEYSLAGVFGFWVVLSLIEFVFRYPRYRARNDVCTIVRHVLGLPPYDSAQDKAVNAHVRRERVRSGLRKVISRLRRQQQNQENLDSILSVGNLAEADEQGDVSGSESRTFDLDIFSDFVGRLLSAEQRKLQGSLLKSTGRLLLGCLWDRLFTLNYARCGAEYAVKLFVRSYKMVVDDTDLFGSSTMQCEDDIAADVILHALMQHERHWFREGSLMFPYRTLDEAQLKAERQCHQMARTLAILRDKKAELLNILESGTCAARSSKLNDLEDFRIGSDETPSNCAKISAQVRQGAGTNSTFRFAKRPSFVAPDMDSDLVAESSRGSPHRGRRRSSTREKYFLRRASMTKLFLF